jgi:hypothetical protein
MPAAQTRIELFFSILTARIVGLIKDYNRRAPAPLDLRGATPSRPSKSL